MGAKGAYIVRLLMVGDSSCGKTSLVLRFDQNVFSTKFVTTIGVDYRDKMVKVRRRYSVLLWREGLFLMYDEYAHSFVIRLALHFYYRLKEHQCVYNFGTQLDKRDSGL
jgi:GTPase SAR1 family protein